MAAAAEDYILKVTGLKTWFPIKQGVFRRTVGHVKAVDGLDLNVAAGQTLALVGESGCGKTTVGRTILQLENAKEGTIEFEGIDLGALSKDELHPFRKHLQIIFQDPMSSLDPRMRVHDSLVEGMISFGIGENAADRTERAKALMETVKLDPEQVWRFPHEFSGGQRQRLCIARALAVEPKFIVCDESVSALDVSIQAQILNLLQDLQKELGIAYLFITHDLSVVRYLADYIAVMYLGQIVEEGETESIFAHPRHPYTEALLASIPSLDPDHRTELKPTAGDVPSPINPPEGCRFHTRCKYVRAECKEGDRPFTSFSDGRSRCLLASETGFEPN